MIPQISANLASSWVSAPLGELVDILDSQRRPVNSDEREKRPGSVPYYGATGQVGWIDGYLFNEELVLLGEDGAPFLDPAKPKAYLIEGKSWVNNHAHVLRAKCGISNRFLMYQLNQIDYRRFVSGTTRLKLPQAPMKQIPLAVAPEPEQPRIVAEIEKQFTRLEAAVAALKRVQANLKRYRAAVLKAAVEGRLVPTEAELARAEGRSYETADQLLQRILAERRTRWEADQLAKMRASGKEAKDDKWKARYEEQEEPDTSKLPPLPEGWKWVTMPQLGELNRGKSKHRPRDDARLFGGPYPFIQTGDVKHSGGYIRNHSQTYNEIGLAQSRLWAAGTLCITIAANIAESGILTYPACFPDSVVGFRMEGYAETIRFVQFFLDTAKAELARFAPATAQKNINLETLSDLAIPLPPLTEQQRIVAEVERRVSVLDELEMQTEANLKRAERLRQAILKRAFEGKLVPQDPGDEPASVLLERIRAERETKRQVQAQARKRPRAGKATAATAAED